MFAANSTIFIAWNPYFMLCGCKGLCVAVLVHEVFLPDLVVETSWLLLVCGLWISSLTSDAAGAYRAKFTAEPCLLGPKGLGEPDQHIGSY
jgi:hypothetical protein